jgi:hypothetical protein
MDDIFKLRLQTNTVGSEWRDGVKMVYYNWRLHQMGGWNFNETPVTCSHHYVSEDDGITWTQLADAPWNRRHCGGVGVYDDKIWIWFGDDNQDLWYYNDADGWTEVTTVMNGLSAREHSSYALIDGYAYIMNGFPYGEVYNKINNIYRINLAPDSNFEWELHSAVTGDMQNIDSACLVWFKGFAWFFGGGRISGETPPYFINTKIWKSADLITWALVKNEPLFNSGCWADAAINGEYICYISGSDDENNMTGVNNRLMLSADGENWVENFLNIPGRHATAVCNMDRDFIISRGYLRNDCWLLKHIASQYRCDIGILND